MWPWRGRSTFENLCLPKKCFISHSYQDAEAREGLLAQLPRGVKPFVYPPITVPPEQLVSDKLLDAIRNCDGLIYLEGGASADSFWVALERDYALRLGKPVFAYTPSTIALIRDQSSSMDIHVFISFSTEQWGQASRIVDTMRQRFIDPWFFPERLKPGVAWDPEISHGIDEALEAGGYIVALWSSGLVNPVLVNGEIEHAGRRLPGRVLVAILEREQPPLLFRAAKSPIVQLYGDEERSFVQRIDDLIVRLYWLIYENTRQNQLT
jgi:hypothetical protein